jgi:cyclophilin family peptidyl-prolyl cis-trans isomerase
VAFIEVSTSRRIHQNARTPLLFAAGLAIFVAGCSRSPSAGDGAPGPPGVECVFAGRDRTAVPFLLETSEGRVRCTIDAVRAPRAAAMVVGLAAGRAPFRDPGSGEIARRPYYQDMLFFRAIDGVLVQTGCPLSNGTGHPGYRIPVEADPGDGERLARPGALFLARYTPPPNRPDPAPPRAGEVIGPQLVVGLTNMSHLAGEVTVLGACADLDVVRRIAGVVARKERKVHLLRAEPEGSPGASTNECGP